MNEGATVLSHLRRGRLEWPEPLVPSGVHARLVAAAGKLPDPVTGLFVECHLCDPERTDFGVRMSRGDRDESLRGGRCPESFRSFFAVWRDDSHPAARLQTIDIELDMDGADAVPIISPSLEPDLLGGFEAIERRTQAERAAGTKRRTLDLGLPVLRTLDRGLPEAVLAQVERCTEALPRYGLLIPVWVGSARRGGLPEPSVRATFVLPRMALRSYLASVEWTGDVEWLERHVDILTPSSPWIGFDADVLRGGLGLRVGLYQEHAWVRPWDTDLSGALERVDGLEVCDPGRLQGLRTWVASQPERPRPGEARSLSLKVVIVGRNPPVVKAYLSTFDEALAIRRLSRGPEV